MNEDIDIEKINKLLIGRKLTGAEEIDDSLVLDFDGIKLIVSAAPVGYENSYVFWEIK